MRSIAVSELRSNLMRVLKRVERGSTVVITSRGKIVAKLTPPDDLTRLAEEKLIEIRKTAKIHDILSPVSEEWEADS